MPASSDRVHAHRDHNVIWLLLWDSLQLTPITGVHYTAVAIFTQCIALITAAVIGAQSVGAVVLTSSVRGTLIDICDEHIIITLFYCL